MLTHKQRIKQEREICRMAQVKQAPILERALEEATDEG
jgi:hypothetical protein